MRTDDRSTKRRTVLATGLTILGAGLAGCTAGGRSGPSDGAGGGGSTGDGDGSSTPPSFDGWMANVGNYDGVVDETGRSEVTVRVGADGNGGAFAFEPAAVAVSPGTTVIWEWTGNGGVHNVVAADGGFESESTSEAGATFEHAFEDPGTYAYACRPHEVLGMKGVVVVE
jgi:halocyanin-like protein